MVNQTFSKDGEGIVVKIVRQTVNSNWHSLSKERRAHEITHVHSGQLLLVNRQQELNFLQLARKLSGWG